MKEKYCPLKNVIFLSIPSPGVQYCDKEECAWWDAGSKKCAILKIAEKAKKE